MKFGPFSFGNDHKIEGIRKDLSSLQPLPIGLTEFHDWSERIISGSGLPATIESQKYTLANMLLNLKPTQAFEADVYFIHALRKAACNQVADYYRKEVYAKKQAKMAEEALEKQKQAEVTAPMSVDAEVLENTGVPATQPPVESEAVHSGVQ